jgi:hypothetical protein
MIKNSILEDSPEFTVKVPLLVNVWILKPPASVIVPPVASNPPPLAELPKPKT